MFTGELKKKNGKTSIFCLYQFKSESIYQKSRVTSNISLSKNDFRAQSKLT